MIKKMDNKAQGSQILLLLLFMVIVLVIMPTFGPILGTYFGYVLEPTIGFSGEYPILTLFFAGLIVVTLSSLLTNFFTDWKKMGEAQEIQKAFQKEMMDARKKGDTNRIKKLTKMQPDIMKRQTEASSGMMKPMIFLIIFIFPIFMWLRTFLGDVSYFYFTVPWANSVSLFSKPVDFLWQAWLWLYLIFSMVFGQLLRAGFKWIGWSEGWRNFKEKIKPSSM
jgi:uncharacterized membrane protein (DUF106 family)